MPEATLAGRYILESVVSKGGMATVWRARDEVLARPIAIKILHDHLADDQEFLERFRREALAAARLTHPNIVAIYDTGTETGKGAEQHYIVMEYCAGGTLADVLTREGALPPERVAALGTSIADALGYAHSHDVVHRDVKPANVLIAEDGTVKVGDFGIAKAAFTASDITTTGTILGTVAYVSPEQAQGLEPDARSDIYQLGVVLFELATGRQPFQGDTQIATAMMHLREQAPSLRTIKPGTPRQLEAVVARALEKGPAERFASAEEMRSALESITGPVDSRTVVQRTPAVIHEGPPPTDTRWIVRVIALIAAAVGLVLVLAWALSDPIDGAGDSGRNVSGNGAAQQQLDATASDFDPHGDSEHPEDAQFAVDGDPSTQWETQTYNDALSLIKPGVGLLFDLGDSSEVARVEVEAEPGLDLSLLHGDSVPSDETALEVADERADVDAITDFRLEPTTARYWVVWITDLPGGAGGSSYISEVTFFGP